MDEELIAALPVTEEDQPNCLVFVRKIKNIDYLHNDAATFCDVIDGEKDEVSASACSARLEMVESVVAASNIFRFETNWSKVEGINLKDNKAYLDEFGSTFEREVWERIGLCLYFLRCKTQNILLFVLFLRERSQSCQETGFHLANGNPAARAPRSGEDEEFHWSRERTRQFARLYRDWSAEAVRRVGKPRSWKVNACCKSH